MFIDLGDAQQRIGLFIDHYNFQRPHQGIDGLVPADRFFGAADGGEARRLQARVAAQRAGAGAAWRAQGAVLPDRPGGRPAVQRARRRRARDPDQQRWAAGDRPVANHRSSAASLPVLPEPVCPHGVVSASGEGFEDPPEPGTSPLDDGLDDLRDAGVLPPEGGAS